MKRIILKINVDGSIEPFTSLEKLFVKHENLRAKKSTIEYYLTRKKTEYVSENYKLRRVVVNET